MKDELYKQILVLIFGGILGALFKYLYDYRGMVHRELWARRYDTYKKMFLLAGNFPLYPEKSLVSYQELLKTSEDMRDWFFREGGMLLSTKTRNKYFKVQKNIQAILKENIDKDTAQKITEDQYDSVRQLLSQFRKTMTDDLMSRTRA